MIKSMTGFGRGSLLWNEKKINIEIKSINSKNLDISWKWIGIYRELEGEMRPLLNGVLQRGKIEVLISIREEGGEANAAILQSHILKAAFDEAKNIALKEGLSAEGLIPALLQRNEVWKNPALEEGNYPESELNEVRKILTNLFKEVLEQLDCFRSTEGEILQKDMLLHVEAIEKYLSQVQAYEERRIQSMRERLRKALNDIDSKRLDHKESEGRFEEEMIYYLEKWDITEEKVRLTKHAHYFKECISEEGAGKKLGFITQEMGREINTLGSKANEVHIQKLVVGMKDELEKIKEQLFNIL